MFENLIAHSHRIGPCLPWMLEAVGRLEKPPPALFWHRIDLENTVIYALRSLYGR